MPAYVQFLSYQQQTDGLLLQATAEGWRVGSKFRPGVLFEPIFTGVYQLYVIALAGLRYSHIHLLRRLRLANIFVKFCNF